MPLDHIFTCQTCGKRFEDKKSAYRKPKYCSPKCRSLGHRKRITLTCCQCKRAFETTPSQSYRKYCSKECRLKAGWAPTDSDKKCQFACKNCGQTFVTWAYRSQQFCSRQCNNEYASKLPRIKSRRPESWVHLTCEWCKQAYTIHKGIIDDPERNSRFCSADCRNNAMSAERRGPLNPMWKGGHNPEQYGPNWERQKRKAKRRDRHTCRICGYRPGGSVILDVHHITPARIFKGDWKSSNQLGNLITLCRICHVQVEHGKLPCPRAT